MARPRLATALGGLLRASRLVGLSLMALVLYVQTDGGDDSVAWRRIWWDALQQNAPRDRGDPAKTPVVIVAIDKATVEGNDAPWPWPRYRLAEVVLRLSSFGARVIAFDILFTGPDPQSPTELAKEFEKSGFADVSTQMREIGDWDRVLADSLHDGIRDLESGQKMIDGVPSVFPLSGVPAFGAETLGDGCERLPRSNVQTLGNTSTLQNNFPAADPPPDVYLRRLVGLKETALAAVNFQPTKDFVVRRLSAVQHICGRDFLSLGGEALRIAKDGFYSQILDTKTGLEVVLGDQTELDALRFPVERDGSFWLRFGPLGDRTAVEKRYISAQALFPRQDPITGEIVDDFDRSLIDGKIVLLAVTELGSIDERKSPLGETIWGVEVHAQMIEQVLSRTFLRRPGFLFIIETALVGALALLVILLLPGARPVRSIFALVGCVAGLLVLSRFLFTAGILFDMASPVLGLLIVSAGVLSITLIERDRARLFSEIELQTERADRSFLQGELDAAARIQTALLPPRRFERARSVDLACYIDPARTVGGDFYDHFMVDDSHLFFLVADVSGKGADASQFMLLSKTLWKSVALRTQSPLETIQIEANAEITRENTATMFVTGLCGLLNLETGELSYSSAGHDAPYLFSDAGKPEQLDEFSGPPAGLVEDMEYPVGHAKLRPGERICIFTDGVTEAMDEVGELFGAERLEAALGAAPAGLDSQGLVDHIVERVRRFTGNAEQSDDLTLMVISIPD